MSKPNIISLDIGTKRVGVARANKIAKIAEPLTTLENNNELFTKIADIADQQNADLIVIGLPRNLESKETSQTEFTRELADEIAQKTKLNIEFYDEAISSIEATERLTKLKKHYSRSDVDSMAAAVILDNFMETNAKKVGAI